MGSFTFYFIFIYLFILGLGGVGFVDGCVLHLGFGQRLHFLPFSEGTGS